MTTKESKDLIKKAKQICDQVTEIVFLLDNMKREYEEKNFKAIALIFQEYSDLQSYIQYKLEAFIKSAEETEKIKGSK